MIETESVSEWARPLLLRLAVRLYRDRAELTELLAAGVPRRTILELFPMEPRAWVQGCAELIADEGKRDELAELISKTNQALNPLLAAIAVGAPSAADELVADAVVRQSIGHLLSRTEAHLSTLAALTFEPLQISSNHELRFETHLPIFVETMERLADLAER